MKYELERSYPGDEAWEKFVQSVPDYLAEYQYRAELVRELSGQMDLAKVVRFLVGDAALSWIKEPVPLLDGLAVRDCIASEHLLLRLRTMLNRMSSGVS